MKVVLTNLANLSNEASVVSTLASNNDAITDAIDNTLSRDGSAPNEMEADIDMNGNSILNLPSPTTDTEPATKAYVDLLAGLADSSAVTAAVSAAQAAQAGAETAEDNVEAIADALPTGLSATSTDSITPTVGAQSISVQADKLFQLPMWVYAQSDSNSAIWFTGPVTSYSGTTLIVDVQAIGTASAKTDWTIVVSGRRGTTGAAGADYTADNNLNAIHGIAATGLYARTGASTAAARTITGTSNLISVTNGDGVSGNPTLTVGSNVARLDQDGVLASGVAHTHTTTTLTAASATGTQTALDITAGYCQEIDLSGGAGTYTFPISVNGNGEMVLKVGHSGAGTATVAFTVGSNTAVKNLGGTFTVGTGKFGFFYFWKIGGYIQYQAGGTF